MAGTDATVLLQGQTGTGKELMAHAIHRHSAHRHHACITVNGAAIQSGSLESELFGHERGAFTGALAQKLGRFELAHQGTRFLDAIGDLPLDLQPKLLRVLQEQAFERLGSPHTRRVDVRLVAATHRELAQLVEAGHSAPISTTGCMSFPSPCRRSATGPRIFRCWCTASCVTTRRSCTSASTPSPPR